MSSDIYISDHDARTLALLIQQFKNADNFKALISAVIASVQELEDVFEEFRLLRWLATAEGMQLDGLGEILGEMRLGRSDDEYRIALRHRIHLNKSQGTPEDVMTGLMILSQATKVGYFELPPAKVMLQTNGSEIPDDIKEMIQLLCPVGVGLDTLLCTFGVLTDFRFITEYGPQEGAGFSEMNYPLEGWEYNGGSLSEVL